MKTDQFSKQLRWVILLLAAAVILPTVCLLWFMNQAVKNERLAVRSKLTDIYRNEINRVFNPFLDRIFNGSIYAKLAFDDNSPCQAYHQFRQDAARSGLDSYALFIYDMTSEARVYPTVWDEVEEIEKLNDAHQQEFIQNDLPKALEAYEQVVQANPDNSYLTKHCRLAQARILQKQGLYDAAIKRCESYVLDPLDRPEHWHLYAAGNLKMLHLLEQAGLDREEYAEKFDREFDNLLFVIGNFHLVTSDQHVFLYDKLTSLAAKHTSILKKNTMAHFNDLRDAIELERRSLDVAFEHPDFLRSGANHPVIERIPEHDLYILNHSYKNYRIARVLDLRNYFEKLTKELNFPGNIHVQVLDGEGNPVVGPKHPEQTAFLSFPLAPYLAWSIKFYDTNADSNIFENAARRQTSVYLWTGLLVALLVMAAGGISIHAVNRQIKMNRLKNDFIATVTHELKTPLASMRLLVDTLLEGNYEDQQTATEYLQLVANENKRLTHLIDSFLTFSRMERNKQIFELASVSPVEIANIAIEAVRPKFDKTGVDFEIDVQKPLPMIQVDKDGIVTVLVNLLENAYKYTNGNKQIKLKVYQGNGSICFAVKDNGIGLSPRARRKIFNRFYQVDSRLSRRAEGCGLGLSIVKFIVDAHKGTINVESQLDQGSTFIVKVPVVGGKNGNSINH